MGIWTSCKGTFRVRKDSHFSVNESLMILFRHHDLVVSRNESAGIDSYYIHKVYFSVDVDAFEFMGLMKKYIEEHKSNILDLDLSVETRIVHKK